MTGKPSVGTAARAVRGHWMVESYHWHLDVTFREDGKHTLEKQASYNLNIMRKLSLNILKLVEIGNKKLSLKKKRYAIGTNPEKYIFILSIFHDIIIQTDYRNEENVWTIWH